jgi:toxin YhaV
MPEYSESQGWKLYQHPAFQVPFESLIAKVEAIKQADPINFDSHPQTKLLKRIQELILEEIPANPGGDQYRQGNTLGGEHRHWQRAKFLKRFRLFYRYSAEPKVIIFGWLNDENTLRKAGAKTDPYVVFKKRLEKGDPPSDWDDLAKESGVPFD